MGDLYAEQKERVAQLIEKWNARASNATDEYIGEISMIVIGPNYNPSEPKNDITDSQKLSQIWKLTQQRTEPFAYLNQVREILNR